MRRCLLIADACFTQAERIGHYFSHRGYEIDVVDDGLECIEKLTQSEPDALILDWDLPWGGGAGVLARLRELHRSSNIRVILLADEITDELDSQVPVMQCLQRPFDIERLRSAVNEALHHPESGHSSIHRDLANRLSSGLLEYDVAASSATTGKSLCHDNPLEYATSSVDGPQLQRRAAIALTPVPR